MPDVTAEMSTGFRSPADSPNGILRAVSRVAARTSETVLPQRTLSRIRTARDWKRWINSLTPDLLDALADSPAAVKQRLFKANVWRVEIETHAKCNRVCSFCPNVIADRRQNGMLADATMLDRVFDELGSIEYQRQICVARYSEPLTNLEYLNDRIASARGRAPRAELAITTNTDYLTRPVLDRLREVGLHVMYMSLYLRNGERWSPELAKAYSDHLAKKLHVAVATERVSSTSVQCTYTYSGVRLSSTCHNWDTYGIDRGGTIQLYTKQERTGPCRDPFDTFVIDWNGSVVPCCNVRSDLAEHRELIVGDLSVPGTSIFDVYAGRLARWRQGLVAFGAQSFPCATCRHRELPQELVKPMAVLLGKRLREIDRASYFRPPS
jgi:hypothetical protein